METKQLDLRPGQLTTAILVFSEREYELLVGRVAIRIEDTGISWWINDTLIATAADAWSRPVKVPALHHLRLGSYPFDELVRDVA